jgi:hypothetical protein
VCYFDSKQLLQNVKVTALVELEGQRLPGRRRVEQSREEDGKLV